MKIGFFDSGLGGVVVMNSVIELLPQYDYEFYGDTANLPYGQKSEEEIFLLTKRGVEHLFSADCILVVIACNTASAETLRRLQDEWLPITYPDRKILGVIIPMVEEVILSGVREAILIATTRTIASQKYEREFSKFTVAPNLHSIATPELAPLIEAGKIETAIELTNLIVGKEVREGSALILGCTHYALLKPALLNQFGTETKIFSPTEIIPYKLAVYLTWHDEIEIQLSRGGTQNVYLTNEREDYLPLITFLKTNAV